ncbi:hypothetical protein [Bacillus sinesaloumensis]|uniref:hypothetical protein n=1 Tax=Litchfieldia sinesaloumensis TaxID=1926280 RepID=UPI001F3CC1E1|nr:hypothetical protein [Bacillus sinesaloumensis]
MNYREEEEEKIRIVPKSRSLKMVPIILLFLFLLSLYGYHRFEKDFVYPIVPIAIEAEFLSAEYFTELSEQYELIRSKHRNGYTYEKAKAISSHAILTHMMADLTENPQLLNGHKRFDLYFETFDQHVKQLPSITEEIHYFRNELNQYGEAPEQLNEMIEKVACGKWQLFSARYHRYEVSDYDAAYNVKFISANGRFEVVYHAESGQKVTDSVNMGTYNFAPGSIHPWKYYQHHKYDKVPWKKWGNTNQISYKEITKRKSRHGSTEQKKSTEELHNVIKNNSSGSQECQ